MNHPSSLNWLGRLYLWGLERLYQEFAWAYEAVAWIVSAGQWSGWRKRAIPHLVGRRVLEIGFGPGRLALALLNAGFDVYGVDLSWSMVRISSRRLMRRGDVSGRVQQAQAQRLPYQDAVFDSVTFTFPSNYALSLQTLREVWRVLRPGGRLVVVDGGFRTPTDRHARITERARVGSCEEGRLPYEALARQIGFDVSCERIAGRLYAIWVLVATKKTARDQT